MSSAPRRKLSFTALGLIAAFVFFLAVPFMAPIVLGPRGDLLALVFEWILKLALGAIFACFFGFVFFQYKGGWKRALVRWASFVVFLVFSSIGLFAAWEAALSATDLVLPFKQQDVVIAKTYYEHEQTGRGAMPESGGWHIVTPDQNDYLVRASGNGNRLRAGRYKIRLSRFKKLVMVAEPLR
jgi:hypothetical protein